MNEIYVTLGTEEAEVAGHLWQYDYGQRMVFTGVQLPETYEVHFSNEKNGESITMIGDGTGVDIPDELLLTGDSVHAWIYLHTGDSDGETIFHILIYVYKRAKPTSQQPTPQQQDAITQLMAELESLIQGVALIDDTAGIGDTNKVWSASKTKTYIDSLVNTQPAQGVRF